MKSIQETIIPSTTTDTLYATPLYYAADTLVYTSRHYIMWGAVVILAPPHTLHATLLGSATVLNSIAEPRILCTPLLIRLAPLLLGFNFSLTGPYNQ